ncbi:MAG: ATPase [Candidatus Amulumruptor caecigallinarius]|uniref:ATPase n=1 Tax=Candidatus Amulumruptor caecigallinarius TaxID=2109911 RepID=A0A4Q0U9S7_9BACT|nr:MAG: ATPase [Candidatus Amulumruptor caecigallinarius]HJE39799.1 ATPase [Candidatus Amulumruptor caecigallinarius]
MILIADGGSTKIEWCLLVNQTVIKRFVTQGLNPVMLTKEEITSRLEIDLSDKLLPWRDELRSVYFYGAGCLSGEASDMMREAIQPIVGSRPNIDINNDLLSAARALCGNHPGIACILGTGSNSCYYDGEKIVDNISPLGFILGDEGSGAVLGRQLICDVLKHQLPAYICEEFLSQYNLDTHTIIKRVYRSPAPNKFLASLSLFIHKHLDIQEIRHLVKHQFDLFFKRNISNYRSYGDTNVNFVGSIAYFYQDILREAADEAGYSIAKIIRSPMDGLIEYHQS